MAMTLRLTDQETEALRRRAELEGRSMQDVARQAVRDYIERNSKRGADPLQLAARPVVQHQVSLLVPGWPGRRACVTDTRRIQEAATSVTRPEGACADPGRRAEDRRRPPRIRRGQL